MSKSGKVFVFPSSEGGRPPIGTEGEVRLVYCGRRATRPLGPGSKVYHQYIYLEDVDEALKMSDDYPMSFSNPLGSSKRSLDIPGGIYRGVVKCEEDEDGYVGTIVYGVGSWEYCGVIESDALKASIAARHHMANTLIKGLKKQKADKKADWLREYLEPVRRAYASQRNSTAQTELLGRIIHGITGGWD